jgi:hypothetical protein
MVFMFDCELYLAFPVDSLYQKKLDALPKELRDVFIHHSSNHSEYLSFIQEAGQWYLGKKVGLSIDSAALDLIRSNIYSLLRRLVPEYPYEQTSLVLMAQTSDLFPGNQ